MNTRYGNFSDEDIKLSVKYGAQWMDENHPNWAVSINLTNLEMGNCEYCIIGQAIGDYEGVVDAYGDGWAAKHGFFAPSHYNERNYGCFDEGATNAHYMSLEKYWTAEVRDRLGV